MIYTILLILITFAVTIVSLISIGEIIAISYPNSKYTKWWRENIIYNEPNK